MSTHANISAALQGRRAAIQEQWTRELAASLGTILTKGRITLEELRAQCRQLLEVLEAAMRSSSDADSGGPAFREVRAFLEELTRRRVQAGFSSSETATFVFSLKRPLFDALRADAGGDANRLADDVWMATELLDQLGLHTVRAFQATREEVIHRQQNELLELSTPVVKLWDGILALPMIGTLDSARTQVVMESLLQRIVETESQIAIIDITGVPTVDTLVAQHLLKTVTALRLMGADCIISGVRPQIAQTIVHLGVDLQGVTTKANLADALALALKRTGVSFGH